MSIKATFLAALAASALVATTASASYMFSGSSLQRILDDITAGGPSSINVNDDQYQPDEKWSLTASGASSLRLIVELAGFADYNSFGVYDPNDTYNTVQLFGGGNSAGDVAFMFDAGGNQLVSLNTGGLIDVGIFSGAYFGFYLDTPNGTFYSEQSQNADDGADHMIAFQGAGSDYLNLLGTSALSTRKWTPNEFILAWEDLYGLGDRDYDDFVVMVESVVGVPEPSTLALYGISLLGLGSVVVGRNFRRRKS